MYVWVSMIGITHTVPKSCVSIAEELFRFRKNDDENDD